MKTKIISVVIIALFSVANVCAQKTYQTFESAGFKIKCGCNLYVNSTFMQIARQQGDIDVIASYICAENQDNPDIAVLVNINVYDESKTYNKIQPSRYAYFEKGYLEKYATCLSNAGISYNYTTYQGVSALEYTFDQLDLPTKAIMFLKNQKSFLLQVGSRKNLSAKYYALKSNFEIL